MASEDGFITDNVINVHYFVDFNVQLRGEIWAHKTSLTPPLFIEMLWTCVLWVSILPVSTTFPLELLTVPPVWSFFSFYFDNEPDVKTFIYIIEIDSS